MSETHALLLKVALIVFMASNLLDMGLRLQPGDAWRGIRNWRFVSHVLLWGFVIGTALAWLIARTIPPSRPSPRP